MTFKAPPGWEKDSQTLYIHKTGVRIQLRTYLHKEGWFLVPTDLDEPVVGFEPTPDGRDKAFEAFAIRTRSPKKESGSSDSTKKSKKTQAGPEVIESAGDREENDEEDDGDGDADS